MFSTCFQCHWAAASWVDLTTRKHTEHRQLSRMPRLESYQAVLRLLKGHQF